MKDYTVSIKHYLNTNVKPSVIGGENYYPIFVLITAKRKTTKFKSLVFTELYTEQMYNDIMTSTDKEDKESIKNELTAIEQIARLTINELNEFNPLFFSAYVNFSNSIDIHKNKVTYLSYETAERDIFLEYKREYLSTDINNLREIKEEDKYGITQYYLEEITDKELKEKEKNSLLGFGTNLLNEYIKEKYQLKRHITLFEFYGQQTQQIIKEYLKPKILKYSIDEVVNDINKLHFYRSIEYFKFFTEGSKRTRDLPNTYNDLFVFYMHKIISHLKEKYKP